MQKKNLMLLLLCNVLLFSIQNNFMDWIVLAYLDFFKGNLKMMLLIIMPISKLAFNKGFLVN